MRWSIKSLLLYVAAFAACLTLCFLPRFEVGALILCVVVLAMRYCLTKSKWRFVTFGALSGVISATVGALIYSHLRVGVLSANNYQSMALVANALSPLRAYIFPLGSFIGGSIGLLLYQRQQQFDQPVFEDA
jgi:hypothetical protein